MTFFVSFSPGLSFSLSSSSSSLDSRLISPTEPLAEARAGSLVGCVLLALIAYDIFDYWLFIVSSVCKFRAMIADLSPNDGLYENLSVSSTPLPGVIVVSDPVWLFRWVSEFSILVERSPKSIEIARYCSKANSLSYLVTRSCNWGAFCLILPLPIR